LLEIEATTSLSGDDHSLEEEPHRPQPSCSQTSASLH